MSANVLPDFAVVYQSQPDPQKPGFSMGERGFCALGQALLGTIC